MKPKVKTVLGYGSTQIKILPDGSTEEWGTQWNAI